MAASAQAPTSAPVAENTPAADAFADRHSAIREDLQLSMERALRWSRSQQLKAKPTENVAKSISLMMDVDPRLFSKLDPDERDALKSDLTELAMIIKRFKDLL